jgi:S1-C subfamily serine protease
MVDGIGAMVRYTYDDYDRQISRVYFDDGGQAIPIEVEVTKILPESTAARIGLKAGDRLLSYDGELSSSTEQLIARIGKAYPGTKELTYRRGETTFSVQVPAGRLGVVMANVRVDTPARH